MRRAPGGGRDEAVEIVSGELRASFLPSLALLGCSLRHRGEELLAFPQPLAAYRELGRVTGLPLLFPWANRLAGLGYRCAGADVSLLDHLDLIQLDAGLPIHGVRPGLLPFRLGGRSADALQAEQRSADAPGLAAVFPYPYRLSVRASIAGRALVLETQLEAAGELPVPVSFGYHPYLRLPGAPRDQWLLELPLSRERLELDERQIPTGERRPEDAPPAPLRGRALDDGFALPGPVPQLSVSAAGRRLSVRLESGYGYGQVFAPPDQEVVALEPMTAPANALRSGDGLRYAEPGRPFRARFAIAVEDQPAPSPGAARRS